MRKKPTSISTCYDANENSVFIMDYGAKLNFTIKCDDHINIIFDDNGEWKCIMNAYVANILPTGIFVDSVHSNGDFSGWVNFSEIEYVEPCDLDSTTTSSVEGGSNDQTLLLDKCDELVWARCRLTEGGFSPKEAFELLNTMISRGDF